MRIGEVSFKKEFTIRTERIERPFRDEIHTR